MRPFFDEHVQASGCSHKRQLPSRGADFAPPDGKHHCRGRDLTTDSHLRHVHLLRPCPSTGASCHGLAVDGTLVGDRQVDSRNPMDVAILGILATVPVSLYASVDWGLSRPKVCGLILGVASSTQ